MSDPVELTDHQAVIEAATQAYEAADELEVTPLEFALGHQKSHCLQIHALEAQVLDLQQAVIILSKVIAPGSDTPPKEETVN